MDLGEDITLLFSILSILSVAFRNKSLFPSTVLHLHEEKKIYTHTYICVCIYTREPDGGNANKQH